MRQSKLLFYGKLAEKALQTYERDGWGEFPTQIVVERREIRPTADRGPILLCVDTSGICLPLSLRCIVMLTWLKFCISGSLHIFATVRPMICSRGESSTYKCRTVRTVSNRLVGFNSLEVMSPQSRFSQT